MTQEGARANVPQFANLPAYIEPAVQSMEREIVRKLTELPENLLEAIDDNVAACEGHQPTTSGSPFDQISNGKQITHTDIGKSNLRGEYESMKAIHAVMPEFVPEPVAVGTYASNSDVHFYLMGFLDMTDETPGPEALPKKVAEMHEKCTSPNGNYGFHVPTNMGALVQPNTWNESWESYYTDMLQRCFKWEQAMHGKNPEMEELFEVIVLKVIPRLLRPLETGGNEIQPCLVHGDLWDGNTSTDADDDRPLIFDASSTYAHNEFELAPWSLDRHQIYKQYIWEYRKHFARSQPEEDFEGRLRLYALAIEDMRYLVSQYPEGYEGKESRKGTA
ncbi:hypothetical protein UCRPC4_g00843 [Phaeomoniella chlamydospora]|uniref:protein-ribulosamine 3-kinase n=1 Tax=Phaeomoniella chlamydospora TaxID=158046 RepID=A0A0G2GXG1_PHACM|nr:hypothetical protein UCRPC4_g00843 [Phaeomoniella chlamydospora]